MKLWISPKLILHHNVFPTNFPLSHVKSILSQWRIPSKYGFYLLPDHHYFIHSFTLSFNKVDPKMVSITNYQSLVSFLNRYTPYPLSLYVLIKPNNPSLLPFKTHTIFNLHASAKNIHIFQDKFSDLLLNSILEFYEDNDTDLHDDFNPIQVLLNSSLELRFFANPLLGSSDFSSSSVADVYSKLPFLIYGVNVSNFSFKPK